MQYGKVPNLYLVKAPKKFLSKQSSHFSQQRGTIHFYVNIYFRIRSFQRYKIKCRKVWEHRQKAKTARYRISCSQRTEKVSIETIPILMKTIIFDNSY